MSYEASGGPSKNGCLELRWVKMKWLPGSERLSPKKKMRWIACADAPAQTTAKPTSTAPIIGLDDARVSPARRYEICSSPHQDQPQSKPGAVTLTGIFTTILLLSPSAAILSKIGARTCLELGASLVPKAAYIVRLFHLLRSSGDSFNVSQSNVELKIAPSRASGAEATARTPMLTAR